MDAYRFMPVDPTMMVDSFDLSFHVGLAEQLVVLVLECNQCKTKSIHPPSCIPNVWLTLFANGARLSSNSDWPQWIFRASRTSLQETCFDSSRSKDIGASVSPVPSCRHLSSRCGDAVSCRYLSKSISHMRRLRKRDLDRA